MFEESKVSPLEIKATCSYHLPFFIDSNLHVLVTCTCLRTCNFDIFPHPRYVVFFCFSSLLMLLVLSLPDCS